MRQLRFVKFWLGIGWLFVGLVIIFSLIPSPPLWELKGSDKLFHLITYLLLMFWFGLIYLPGIQYRNLGIMFIVMGIILEVIQGLLGYRSMEYFDMIVNGFGVVIGWLLARTPISSFLLYLESRLDINTKGIS